MMPSKYKFYHTSLGQDCENIRVASWTLKKKRDQRSICNDQNDKFAEYL